MFHALILGNALISTKLKGVGFPVSVLEIILQCANMGGAHTSGHFSCRGTTDLIRKMIQLINLGGLFKGGELNNTSDC